LRLQKSAFKKEWSWVLYCHFEELTLLGVQLLVREVAVVLRHVAGEFNVSTITQYTSVVSITQGGHVGLLIDSTGPD
jgi:hypothetical protein